VGWYDSAELVVTPAQGAAMAEALGDRALVVLRNHGIAAADTSVEGAVVLAVGFERSLRVQLLAAQLGEVVEIRPDELASMVDYFERSYGNRTRITFEYLRRRAGA
jgi:ribulose-5-phosphate 4-epimerase/fuculose-1-phosphate aldolase